MSLFSVHDSHAYRNIDVTKDLISLILVLSEISLSFHIVTLHQLICKIIEQQVPEVRKFLVETSEGYDPPSSCLPLFPEWVPPYLADCAAFSAAQASDISWNAALTVTPSHSTPPFPFLPPLTIVSPQTINSWVSFTTVMAGIAFHFSKIAVETVSRALPCTSSQLRFESGFC